MDKNLQPQSSEDNDSTNDVKQNRSYLLGVAFLILFYGMMNKDSSFIWAAIALLLMHEPLSRIKKFLLLLKSGEILPDNAKRSKDKGNP